MSNGLEILQEALPRWVRLERHTGEPMVKITEYETVGVVEVNGYPEAPPEALRADVHFVVVAPTEGFPSDEELIDTVKGALGQGEFAEMDAAGLAGGPSYITLGGWLGSQDLALMLIGAVELAGIANAITPKVLGLDGDLADDMAGKGFVMLGPSKRWEED